MFGLSGRDADGFEIDTTTGRITLGEGTSSDFETNTSTCISGRTPIEACYNLTVTATDPGGLKDTLHIFARVLDGPENYGNIRPPTPPRNLTASGGTAGVALSWDAPTGNGRPASIVGYRVEYNDDLHLIPEGARPQWRTLKTITSGTTTTYTDTPGPRPGTTRHYWVRATNDWGAVGYRAMSSPSNTATARRFYGPQPDEITSGQSGVTKQVTIRVRMSATPRRAPAAELFAVKVNDRAVEIASLGIRGSTVNIDTPP